MSGSTPQAEDPGGPSLSPGPDTHPGPGDGDHARPRVQPDIGADPATEPGQVTAPDNRPPEWSSGYPAPQAGTRWRIWLGIIAGFMILVAVIAGISVYLLNRSQSQKWTLTAPPTLLGMSPDTNPTDQLSLTALIAKFKSDLTSLHHYGSLKSTVSGIYRLSPSHAIGLIGFNGTFNVRVLLRTGDGLTVKTAKPGPHGGTAACGTDGINTLCQWSTGTTVGVVVAIPASLGAGPEKRGDVHRLMLEIRKSIEHPVH
jgi:hypothetical protein